MYVPFRQLNGFVEITMGSRIRPDILEECSEILLLYVELKILDSIPAFVASIEICLLMILTCCMSLIFGGVSSNRILIADVICLSDRRRDLSQVVVRVHADEANSELTATVVLCSIDNMLYNSSE